MVYLELLMPESEWQSLLSIKEYAKRMFEVEIRRKDEFYNGCSNPSSPVEFSRPQVANVTETLASSNGYNACINGILSQNPDKSINEDGFVVCAPPVIVCMESVKSSNLEKCRKFANIFTRSSPDFKIITMCVDNPHYLETVKACSEQVLETSGALINIHPDQLNFTIQGHHSCVDDAKKQVEMILCDSKISTADEKKKSSALEENSYSDINSINKNSSPSLCHQSSDIANSDYFIHCRNEVNDLSQRSFPNFPSLSDNANPAEKIISNSTEDGDNSVSQLRQIRHPICSDELEEESILADERFKKRVDQASKCGFSHQQVVRVLKTLGVDSSMDDMMRELIKDVTDNRTGDEEQESGCDVCLSSKEEDSDDSETFDVNDSSNLRHIIIDGSNVAMSHGQKVFSCLGIKIVVDWFRNRGHTNITVFVPQWRKEASRPDAPITNQEILTELKSEGILEFTPSRRVGGTRIVCYDDRYVLKLAVQTDSIVVSNDVYRDLVRERDDFRAVVEQRLLMYTFVKDRFMPPDDPLGRQGPSLDNFLRIKPAEPKNKPQNCPYGKKCTYGNKCKFYHSERRHAQKMVAEKLKENAELKLKSGKTGKPVEGPIEKGRRPKQKLSRTVSLVPQESSFSETNKPPLLHSKSLVFPPTDSYLTDLRLKMEQAEIADKSQPSRCVFNQFSSTVNESKGMSEQCNASRAPAASTSPTLMADGPAANVKFNQRFPSSSASHPSSTPLNFPNTPNPERQETAGRYLSGHLLVAKKLSDEDSNGNFFSQHTSRTPVSCQRENSRPFNDRHLSSDPVSLSQHGSPLPGDGGPKENGYTAGRSASLTSSSSSREGGHASLMHSMSGTSLEDYRSRPMYSQYDSGINSGSMTEQTYSMYSPGDTSRTNMFSPPPHLMMYPPSSNGLPPACPPPSNMSWPLSPLPNRMPPESPFQNQNLGNVPYYGCANTSLPHMPMYSSLPFHPSPVQLGHPSMEGQFYPGRQAQRLGTATNVNMYGNIAPVSPYAQYHAQSQLKVLNEEAPIQVEDPRYPIYYNLSSVFGERVVRTFMNRNPDVRNFKELQSLISAYKQTSGL